MDTEDIKDEVKKAISLFKDDTWSEEDLQARIVQIIEETGFKERLERFIHHVMHMRKSQDKYFAGDKSVIGKAKAQEATVDKVSRELLKRLGSPILKNF